MMGVHVGTLVGAMVDAMVDVTSKTYFPGLVPGIHSSGSRVSTMDPRYKTGGINLGGVGAISQISEGATL
jgi:hypothetical protein